MGTSGAITAFRGEGARMGLGEKAGNVDGTDSCSRRKTAEGPVCCGLRSMPLTPSGWRCGHDCVAGVEPALGLCRWHQKPGLPLGKTLWRFLESSGTDVPCAPAILPTGTSSKTHAHTKARQGTHSSRTVRTCQPSLGGRQAWCVDATEDHWAGEEGGPHAWQRGGPGGSV